MAEFGPALVKESRPYDQSLGTGFAEVVRNTAGEVVRFDLIKDGDILVLALGRHGLVVNEMLVKTFNYGELVKVSYV
jgi:hypothetical protein